MALCFNNYSFGWHVFRGKSGVLKFVKGIFWVKRKRGEPGTKSQESGLAVVIFIGVVVME
ncbi:hypothetical protein [Daejeonella sp.]|uniref:hypothetical protein n=1 Tax=Daejeonella sp. TaxID=2805397 RepID=UPI003C7710E3